MVRFVVAAIIAAAWLPPAARAQELYHPIPWQSAASVGCVPAPSALTRARLDEALAGTARGAGHGTPLELIATCAVPRRQVAQAFNRGGLVQHGAGNHTAAARFFLGALQADPSFLPARFNLACAYGRLGRADGAIGEIGQIVRAGAAGRDWIRRVHTDADLATVRTHKELKELLAGKWRPADPVRAPVANAGFGPPAPTGPVWEPIAHPDWAPFRSFLIASGVFQQRKSFQRPTPWTPSHPDLKDLVAFTAPSWWRPAPGYVFVVIPFVNVGPNRREGMLIYRWTGADYVAACHEYCNALGAPLVRQARYRTPRSGELRIVWCRDGSTTCSIESIVADGPSLRYGRGGGLLHQVVP